MIPQALKNNRDFVNRMNALGIDDVEAYINKRIALISTATMVLQLKTGRIMVLLFEFKILSVKKYI